MRGISIEKGIGKGGILVEEGRDAGGEDVEGLGAERKEGISIGR